MTQRSVSKRLISFGLVTIPVKFYVSASAKNVSFNLVTPAGNRVKQLLVDEVTNVAVEREETLKGYEVSKGTFVTLTQEEIKALSDADDELLSVIEVVPEMSVSLLGVENTYYLMPDKGGHRAYKLFAAALEKKEVAAIVKWTHHSRENLVAIVASKGVLLAQQLYYQDEIRSVDVDLDKYTFTDKELKLAMKLITSLEVSEFELGKYNNGFKERVLKVIEDKKNGNDFSVPEGKPSTISMNDLITQLQASIDKTA